MHISMALLAPPHLSSTTITRNPSFVPKTLVSLTPRKPFSLFFIPKASLNNGSSPAAAAPVEVEAPKSVAAAEVKEESVVDNGAAAAEVKEESVVDNGAAAAEVKEESVVDNGAAAEVKEESVVDNGAAAAVATAEEVEEKVLSKFQDPRWVNGTWDLKQFIKGSKTDWDAVIDAEARRRKWLEDNPESTSNDNPVLFDTSIIPWWAWMKRYHLPEAELLNGRAAMVGFFMAYFVDSLTGVGLVDQMGNFFCKTLLFVAVAGVLLVRKNEDVENLKKLLEETTFYDKQWQATWKEDENTQSSKND